MKTALICECVKGDWKSPRPIQDIERDSRSKGCDVVRIPDLCGMAAYEPARLAELFESADIAVIAACAPRAVRWLCARAGLPGETLDSIEFVDYVAPLFAAESSPASDGISGEEERVACALRNPTGKASARPWFPVVDYDKCSNCGACLDFCLFGVFARNAEGNVVVEHPENCKDNCPACARICPVYAVMFPKHTDASINGAATGKRSNHSKPLFAMSGDELYEALKNRRREKSTCDIFTPRGKKRSRIENERYGSRVSIRGNPTASCCPSRSCCPLTPYPKR